MLVWDRFYTCALQLCVLPFAGNIRGRVIQICFGMRIGWLVETSDSVLTPSIDCKAMAVCHDSSWERSKQLLHIVDIVGIAGIAGIVYIVGTVGGVGIEHHGHEFVRKIVSWQALRTLVYLVLSNWLCSYSTCRTKMVVVWSSSGIASLVILLLQIFQYVMLGCLRLLLLVCD